MKTTEKEKRSFSVLFRVRPRPITSAIILLSKGSAFISLSYFVGIL